VKLSTVITIIGVIILLFSYLNAIPQLPTGVTNSNLQIISSSPFSVNETSPTIFPYSLNPANVSIEISYRTGASIPELTSEKLSLKVKNLNNSIEYIATPLHNFTSIIYRNGAYDIIINIYTKFQGLDQDEYAFTWNANLTYNENGVIYYAYLTPSTFYARFASVSVFDIGSFEIHQYVRNWSNASGWVDITPTPLFLNSGNYVIIYNMSHNINFKGAFIRINGHLYSFKQYSGNEYYTIVSVTSTSIVALYLQATNSSPQIYETSLFNVMPPAHYYIGMYIGIGIMVVGILFSMRRRIADVF